MRFRSEDCASDTIYDDLTKSMPDYIVNGVARRRDDRDEERCLMAAIAANRLARERTKKAVRYDWQMERDIDKLRENADGCDLDVEACVRIFGRGGSGDVDIDRLGYGWDSDSVDGEYCECGNELSEPMSIGDVVFDTWPDWAREVFNACTLSIDEEVFFRDVAEQLGESSRRAFYDANRNSGRGQSAWAIEEAIGKVLGRYIHEAQRVQRGRNKLDYSGVMYPLKAS